MISNSARVMSGRVKAQMKRLAIAMLSTNMLLAKRQRLRERITRTTRRFPIRPRMERRRVDIWG